MATTFTSIGDKDDFTTVVGSATDTADTTYVSEQKVRLFTNSPAATASITKNGVLADAGRVISFWVAFSAYPAAATRSFMALFDSSGNAVHVLQLSTSGVLANAPVGATGVSGRTLSLNTRYLITLAYTITNTTTFEFKVYVNGVLDSTANAGTLTRTGTDRLQFLCGSNWAANANTDISGVYVTDDTTFTDPYASEEFFGYPTAGTAFSTDIDTTGDLSEFTTAHASASVDTAQAHGGTESVKLLGVAATNVVVSKDDILCDAGMRGEAWVYMDAYPGSPAFATLIGLQRRDGNAVLAVVVNSSGEIFAQPLTTAFLASGTHVDDGTQTVSLNTWTRISWAYVITGNDAYTFKVWVNGVLSSSQTESYGTLDYLWTEQAVWANRMRTAAKNIWWDDIKVEVSSALSDVGTQNRALYHYRRRRAA